MSDELIWGQGGCGSKAVIQATGPSLEVVLHTSILFISASLHVMKKILTKITVTVVSLIQYTTFHVSPTIVVFDILSADRQGNHRPSTSLSLQVLDRRWHSDASLERPRGRFLQCAQQGGWPGWV